MVPCPRVSGASRQPDGASQPRQGAARRRSGPAVTSAA